MVADTGTAPSTGGRRATFVDFAPSLGCVLAVDIGAINVRIAAADVGGRIAARRSYATREVAGGRRLRRAVAAALDELADAADGPVLAVAVAVPAIVDPRTGRATLSTVPGWPEGEPARWVEHYGAPVLVENEANLAAVGEAARGSGRGARSVLFVAVGAGVGAGLVVNGSLYRGSTGAGGEIGFLVRCGLDSQTRLEDAAAAPAIARRYRELSGAGDVDAEVVFERAAAGDERARAVLAETVRELAIGIANAVLVVDPEVVVVGGGLGAAGPALIDPLREEIRPLVPHMPRVVGAELGPEAALVGCAVWAARDTQQRLRARLLREART